MAGKRLLPSIMLALMFFIVHGPVLLAATEEPQTPDGALGVTLHAPESILTGENIDYTFTVTNLVTETSTGVVVTMQLPEATELVSGGELDDDGQVTLPVGNLPGSNSREVVLTVRPLPPEAIGGEPARLRSDLPVARDDDGRRDSAPQIVGGEEAEPGAWPWQVALLMSHTGDGYDAYYCSGSLLAPNWVLTAAHCVSSRYTGRILDASTVDVAVGRHRLSSDEGQRIPVLQVVRHPAYSESPTDADVALLRLAEPITYTDVIATIAPLAPAQSELAAPGTDATVTGWGALSSGGAYPDALHEVTVPIVAQAVCAQAMNGDITATMLCAGPSAGERDACSGDSGGPLMTSDGEGSWLQAGIVSWGIGCASPGFYGVYARVSSFYQWIEADGRNTYTTPGLYQVVDDEGNSATKFAQLQTVVLPAEICDDPDDPACQLRVLYLPLIASSTESTTASHRGLLVNTDAHDKH